MSDYKTPWLEIEMQAPVSFDEVETSVPAFIGFTENTNKVKNSAPVPVRIESFKEFEDRFGGAPESFFTVTVDDDGISQIEADPLSSYTYYCLSMYFKNQGPPCYIVSLGSYEDLAEAGEITKEAVIEGIDAIESEIEPALLVIADGMAMAESDYYKACDYALKHCKKVIKRFCIFDVYQDRVDDFRENTGYEQLKYGAAYYPWITTRISPNYNESAVTVKQVDYSDGSTTETVLSEISDVDLYDEIINALDKNYIVVPPSGPVAGIYSKTDREKGVWNTPANEAIEFAIGLSADLSMQQAENLRKDTVTGKSINIIRAIPGRGILVWGARTLAGNDNEWRYISVRRLFNMLEEASINYTNFAVFEPNNSMTWLKIKTVLTGFLDELWRAGAFAGTTADQAYYVEVGLDTTMTQDDLLNGLINVEVGIAPAKPAEFIVLRFSHKLEKS